MTNPASSIDPGGVRAAPAPASPRRWGRILLAILGGLLIVYLGLTTLLWGYYTYQRKIPGVAWIDVVILPRFPRVQAAIGDYYFAQAKTAWEHGLVAQAIFTGRAAVGKSPRNLEARLFLANCWLAVGRSEEAVRTLRDGVSYSAAEPRFQQALIQTALVSNRFADALAVMRVDLPAHGAPVLDGREPIYRLAEARAVLETRTPLEAERVVEGYPGLASNPKAAPLLAEIDWQAGRKNEAFRRLAEARAHDPADIQIEDAYVDFALRLRNSEEAHKEAARFILQHPQEIEAQLRFLEAFGSRSGKDEAPWTAVCIGFLSRYRQDPVALGRLAADAATRGWADITYLLYQCSLQERMYGFPFVIYYVESLLKTGRVGEADAVWRELVVRNARETDNASYLAAMIDWGTGRESEAQQLILQMKRELGEDRRRRRTIETVFRDFGYDRLADLLARS